MTQSVWDIISGNPSYSIFAGAVESCGLGEWLDNTYRTIGETTIRENKTVLVVSDEVFRSRGINSLDDLKAWFGGGDPGRQGVGPLSVHALSHDGQTERICRADDFPLGL